MSTWARANLASGPTGPAAGPPESVALIENLSWRKDDSLVGCQEHFVSDRIASHEFVSYAPSTDASIASVGRRWAFACSANLSILAISISLFAKWICLASLDAYLAGAHLLGSIETHVGGEDDRVDAIGDCPFVGGSCSVPIRKVRTDSGRAVEVRDGVLELIDIGRLSECGIAPGSGRGLTRFVSLIR